MRILHFAVAAFLLAWPANAQQQCAPADDTIKYLAEKYNEAPAGVGTVNGINQPVFLLTSPDGATWTMLIHRVVNGQRLACLIMTGSQWQAIDMQRPKGDPS